jgi:hypothetical protein
MSIDTLKLPQLKRFTPQGGRRTEILRKALLAAGALSSLLYVVATGVVAASMWDGYRRTEQMVSELFAVGSPGRDVLLPFTWLYTVLFTAFGVGVWNSVRGNRALRIGGMPIGYGLWNTMGALYPLTLGDDASIPMHIVATNIQVALMVAAMCFVAAGVPCRMRAYSIGAVMGMAAFMRPRGRTSYWASAKESASGHSCSR